MNKTQSKGMLIIKCNICEEKPATIRFISQKGEELKACFLCEEELEKENKLNEWKKEIIPYSERVKQAQERQSGSLMIDQATKETYTTHSSYRSNLDNYGNSMLNQKKQNIINENYTDATLTSQSLNILSKSNPIDNQSRISSDIKRFDTNQKTTFTETENPQFSNSNMIKKNTEYIKNKSSMIGDPTVNIVKENQLANSIREKNPIFLSDYMKDYKHIPGNRNNRSTYNEDSATTTATTQETKQKLNMNVTNSPTRSRFFNNNENDKEGESNQKTIEDVENTDFTVKKSYNSNGGYTGLSPQKPSFQNQSPNLIRTNKASAKKLASPSIASPSLLDEYIRPSDVLDKKIKDSRKEEIRQKLNRLSEKFNSPERQSTDVYAFNYTRELQHDNLTGNNIKNGYLNPIKEQNKINNSLFKEFQNNPQKDLLKELQDELKEAKEELYKERSNNNNSLKHTTEITLLNDKIKNLERNLEYETKKNKDLEEELESMRNTYAKKLADCGNEKSKENDLKIQELNRQIKLINEKNQNDIQELTVEFENGINRLKENYEKIISDMKLDYERKVQESNRLQKEKMNLDEKLAKKSNMLQDSVKSHQETALKLKLTLDLKNEEIEKLNRKLNELKREISIMKSEAELNEQEKSRISIENEKLKNHLLSLEKKIQG